MTSKNNQIKITRAQVDDIPRLAQLEKMTFSGEMNSLALTANTLKNLQEFFPEGILVARHKKTKDICGYICFERHAEKRVTTPFLPYNHDAHISHNSNGKYLYINGFIVKKGDRGKGIGSMLLEKVGQYANRERIKDIYFLLEKKTQYSRTVTFWLHHNFTATSMILGNKTITPESSYDGYVMEKSRLAKAIVGGGVLLTKNEAKIDIVRRVQGASLWLLGRQNKMGFWGERSPWLTGVALYALSRAYRYHSESVGSIIRDSLRRAVSWLEQVQTDGAWDPDVGVWDTAIVLRGLLASAEIDRSIVNQSTIRKGFSWLDREIKEEKALADTYEISRYGRSYIAQAYLAFDDGELTKDMKHKWLVDLCFKEMTKLVARARAQGDHFNAPEMLQAIVRFKEREAKGIQDVVRDHFWDTIHDILIWLERTQSEYGSWGGLTWLTSMALDSYVRGSRIRLKQDLLENIGTADYAIRWLVNQQNLEDFSWFHTLEETVYAIIALLTVARYYSPALYQIAKGIDEDEIDKQIEMLTQQISLVSRETPTTFSLPSESKASGVARAVLDDMGMQRIRRNVYATGEEGPRFEFVGERTRFGGLLGSKKAAIEMIIKKDYEPIGIQEIRDHIDWILDSEKKGFLWLIFVSNVPFSQDANDFVRKAMTGHKSKIRHYLIG